MGSVGTDGAEGPCELLREDEDEDEDEDEEEEVEEEREQ